ncbi:MAG TPA: DUF3696 domain-containing protein [Planctomycetota bacterium]|nr:DUF3696 domain-containing protein [Planctomycetota bacterium]
MLTRLGVTNFKSWKEIRDMQFAPITGLFGANSSGKSSILQLLLMLKQTVESPDRLQALIFGGERTPVDLGSFQDVVHRHDVASSLTFSLGWKLPKRLTIRDPSDEAKVLFTGDELRFGTELRSDAGRLTVKEMAYSFAGHEFQMSQMNESAKYELLAKGGVFTFLRTRGRPWELPPPVKCYGFPDQTKAYYQNAQFLADLQLAFESFFGRLYYLGPLREYPQRQYQWAGAEPADMGRRGENVVSALLASRHTIPRGKPKSRRVSLEAYVAKWLQELGLIHEFSVEQVAKDSNLYRVYVQKTRSSSKVLITDVGFGVSQVLPVLVLCYYVPKGSTILLEQPELHLHPSVQSGLADVFIDAVRKRNVQIIFESHSEHLLQRLQRRVAEKDISKDLGRLYFCDIVDGETKLVPLEMDLFGSIANWPKDFFGDRFGEAAAMAEAAAERQAGEQ